MAKVRVPPEFDRNTVVVIGTEPNDDGEYMGAPRSGDVRVDERYPRNATVREDAEGRYVGVPEAHVGPIREFFTEEFGAEYDDAADTDDESEGNAEGDTSADALPDADATSDAHWRTVTGAIEEGAYDGDLDTVAENDGRESVQNAVEARREALA